MGKENIRAMSRRFWKHSLVALFCAVSALAPLSVGADESQESPLLAQNELAAAAARIVDLTNETRAQNGVGPLQAVIYLGDAATGHSKEMLELNYFSHTSPTPGRTQPKMRIQLANGWDTRIGENIYRAQGIPLAQLADRAMSAWIKSPSHFKNLVDPTFNSIGVGIVPKGDEFAITQNFSKQTIVVKSMKTTPGGAGYELVMQGQVREGSKEGAVFVNDAFKETFTADGSGQFVIKATGPAGSQLSVSQKKPGSNSYAQNLAFPIEAGFR